MFAQLFPKKEFSQSLIDKLSVQYLMTANFPVS